VNEAKKPVVVKNNNWQNVIEQSPFYEEAKKTGKAERV